jgi:hypothetical protein
LPIELHIERLVLDGISLAPRDRGALQSSVETELTRLLTEGGLSTELAGGIALPSLPAGSLNLSAAGTPAQLGAQIARAVYDGIGGTRESQDNAGSGHSNL